MVRKIRFSHYYEKFKAINVNSPVYLGAIFKLHRRDIPDALLEYDTLWVSKDGSYNHYPLVKDNLLVLLFVQGTKCFTTIRRWTPEKERFYGSMIGHEFEIVMS